MRKTIYILPSILLLFWLNGCTSAIVLPTAAPTPENTATISVPETPTPVLTNTPLSATPTTPPPATSTPIPPSSTPTISPEARLQINHLQLFDTFPNNYHLEGFVVLLQTVLNSDPSEKIPVIINLATLEEWQVDLLSKNYIARSGLGFLSPNEKWLVRLKNLDVKEPENKIYEVLSAQGKVQRSITLPWEWVLRKSWLNDHQILADKQNDPNFLVFQTMAIDPINGQKQLLPFDYPGIRKAFDIWSDQYFYKINIYDPSLTYIVYPGDIPDSPPGFILRDVARQKNILASFALEYDKVPAWSPNGKMFAVGSNIGIFGAWIDGKIKNLTHLDKFNGEGVGPAQKLFWSPDSSKIAFTMSPSQLPGERTFQKSDNCLALLGVESESVTAYCLSGYNVLDDFFTPIVWSYDGRLLLIEAHHPDFLYPHSFLIDIEKGMAVDLGEYMEPLYFVRSLPAVWAKK